MFSQSLQLNTPSFITSVSNKIWVNTQGSSTWDLRSLLERPSISFEALGLFLRLVIVAWLQFLADIWMRPSATRSWQEFLFIEPSIQYGNLFFQANKIASSMLSDYYSSDLSDEVRTTQIISFWLKSIRHSNHICNIHKHGHIKWLNPSYT
jgi:hypothetical protein